MRRLETLFSNQRVFATTWVLIDILLINVAFVLAYWVRYELQLFRAVDPAFNVPYRVYLPFVAIFTLLLILVYRQHGIYRLRLKISWFDEFYAIINGTTTSIVIMIVIIFLYRPSFYSRIIFIYAGLLAVLAVGPLAVPGIAHRGAEIRAGYLSLIRRGSRVRPWAGRP